MRKIYGNKEFFLKSEVNFNGEKEVWRTRKVSIHWSAK